MAYHSDDFYKKVAPNFSKFIDELTVLSRKYGVAVSGHYDLTDDLSEFANLNYDRDYTSGDINPRGYWED
jgi:hypothetical protein